MNSNKNSTRDPTALQADLHLVEVDLAWLEEQKQFTTWQVVVVVWVVDGGSWSVWEDWQTDLGVVVEV